VILATARSQLLFGEPLPSDWVGWLVLLIGIWSGLSVLHITLAAFVDQHRKRRLKLRFSGHLLPGGWIAWGGLLIYAEPRPFPILVVLSGLLAMLISAAELRRRL
jgi:hypothetical protein